MKPFNQWSRIAKLLTIGTSVMSVLLIGYFGYIFVQLNQSLDEMYEPVEKLPSNVQSIKDENQEAEEEIINSKAYLILGVDQRPGDIGRTDTIMVAVYNEDSKNITLLSIPRDTYVDIAGKGYKDKINHAYQYGIETSIATVENFTGISFDNYVLFTMEGFVKAIDAVGGIKVDINSQMAYNLNKEVRNTSLSKGENVLTGEQALFYARFRKDSSGDFGRNERQREVLLAFLDKGTNLQSAFKINQLLEVLGDDVKTDIRKGEMYDIASDLPKIRKYNIEQITYESKTDRFGPQNLWYVVVPDEEKDRMTNLLKERLTSKDLQTDVLNGNASQNLN